MVFSFNNNSGKNYFTLIRKWVGLIASIPRVGIDQDTIDVLKDKLICEKFNIYRQKRKKLKMINAGMILVCK